MRRLGKLPSVGELVIESYLISWAFHSDCQESLFESPLNNESSWQDICAMGVGFWYTNKSQLLVKVQSGHFHYKLYKHSASMFLWKYLCHAWSVVTQHINFFVADGEAGQTSIFREKGSEGLCTSLHSFKHAASFGMPF